jgi:hypothetical protein
MISFLIFVALTLISPHDSFVARWPQTEWLTVSISDAPDPRSHFATERQP